MKYVKDSEPPQSYKLWSGISVVAAALQRKCYTPWGLGRPLYPNMFIILVGPSGETRKGSALQIPKWILSEVGIKIAANASTRQALIDEFKDAAAQVIMPDGRSVVHNSLTVFSEELTVFLGYNEQDMLSDLCDWFDCQDEWKKRTKSRDVETIDGVWINLIGATTPMTIQAALPSDLIGGGFTSRVVFVSEKMKGDTISPIQCDSLSKEIVHKNQALWDNLLYDLKQILAMRGIFYFTPNGRKQFDDWYVLGKPDTEERKTRIKNVRFHSYNSRRPTHLAKLSMISSAARGDDLLIHSADVNRALSWLYDTESRMPLVFEGYGTNPLAAGQAAVFAMIEERQLLPLADILNEFSTDIFVEDLQKIITNLASRELVRMDVSNPKSPTVQFLRRPRK